MTNQELIDKIKKKGYWKVEVTPLSYNSSLVPSKKGLIDLIKKHQVRLRGWYYPIDCHWDNPTLRTPVVAGGDWIEGGIDSDVLEFWRFSQSGHFLHIFSMDEDYMQTSHWFSARSDLNSLKPGEVMNTGSVIYKTNEIFTFIESLVRDGIYDKGLKIEITLNGTQNRKLMIFDRSRIPLFMEYKSHSPTINFEKEMTKDEIINDYKKTATDAIINFFESFNWLDSPRHVFEEDQKRFFERRL